MSIQSKYPGKCKDCKIAFIKGTTISTNQNDNWCPKGMDCTVTSNIKSNESTPSNPASAKIHDEIWNFAIAKAKLIYPNDVDKTSRMILAQVFYKKNFDYMIHGT